ncbi:MAG: hypothetical protein IPL96_03825 [Holophagaceae bacterium]|nr:hypothetical protein [Holophagaceae bacterium]
MDTMTVSMNKGMTPAPPASEAVRAELEGAVWAMTSAWLDQGRTVGSCLREVYARVLTLLRASTPRPEKARLEIQALKAKVEGHLQKWGELNLQEHMEVSDALLRVHSSVCPSKPEDSSHLTPWVCFLAPSEVMDPIIEPALASGYRIEHHETAAALLDSIARGTPDLICLGLEHAQDLRPGDQHLVTRIQAGRERPIPIAYLSDRFDLHARLQAICAHGAAFFTTPLNAHAVMEKLDQFTQRRFQEPFRVLIVEDEALTAAFCTRVLESVGMDVLVAGDPL